MTFDHIELNVKLNTILGTTKMMENTAVLLNNQTDNLLSLAKEMEQTFIRFTEDMDRSAFRRLNETLGEAVEDINSDVYTLTDRTGDYAGTWRKISARVEDIYDEAFKRGVTEEELNELIRDILNIAGDIRLTEVSSQIRLVTEQLEGRLEEQIESVHMSDLRGRLSALLSEIRGTIVLLNSYMSALDIMFSVLRQIGGETFAE